MDSSVTGDFIFGTLGTEQLRLEHEQSRSRGVWHGSRVQPRDPQPGDDVTFTVTIGTDISAERVEMLLTRDGSYPGDAAVIVPLHRSTVEWNTLAWGYLEQWQCTVRAQQAEMWRYLIRAVTPNGEEFWADPNETTGEPGLFALSIDTLQDAAWLKDAVIYHVFVDRFSPDGDQHFDQQPTLMDIWGGTLKGVTAHLDYIAHLGATAIWLSPISPSPTHHGYDVTDYTAIEPRLGTVDDFDDLVAEAHSRGIRVILDFVASHASNQHPHFQKALADTTAPERDLFTIHPDNSYESFFGVESMPRINGDSDAAADWLIDAARFWIERGVDGFRLDYAIGQSLQFWTRFRAALREINPEVALIAEAVDSAETLQQYRGRLDGTLDFLFLEQIRRYIGFEQSSASDFRRFYDRHAAWFEDGPITPSFLDNHDMNRFLWVVGGDTRKLKIAALLQFALPQPPIIYYGTEVGLSQWHDLEYSDGSRRMEESRCPMLWGADQDRDLLEFYRSLSHWRHKFGVSKRNPRMVHAGDDGLLIFTTGEWLVAINRSDDDVTIDLGSRGTMWLGLATDAGVKLYGSELILPPFSGVLVANQLAR